MMTVHVVDHNASALFADGFGDAKFMELLSLPVALTYYITN